ncbi:MAG: tetratricopeptide repeat protein, partial [Tannerella sp.]|nr:tetratricopeptide repeat protein [Tannerella sp.]
IFSAPKTEEPNEQKVDLKSFDVFKYDGIRALRIGKTAYAVKCFTEALNIQDDLETMKYLVTAYNALNMNEEALETLDDMVETGEEPVNSLLLRANFRLLSEKYQEAVGDCEQIIDMEPDNYIAYFYMAKAQQQLGERETAIENLNKAIRIKDDFFEGYVLRAELYLMIEKGCKALADIEKANELNPEEESVYLLRGRIYEVLGNAEAAILDYQQALDWNPFNETASLLAGQLMITQGKMDEAITLYDEAIEQNENFQQAYMARAFAKHQTGDHKGALEDETKAKELNPEAIDKPDKNPNFDNLYKGGIY